MTFPTLADLRTRIHEAGLGHHTEALLDVASAAIHLTSHRMADNGPLGAIRLGGLPDLPPGVEWPMKDGILLEFVGQFRLADLALYDAEDRLPPTGMLTGYGQPTRCAVIYHDGPLDALERCAVPSHEYGRQLNIFKPCALDIETVWTLPPFEEIDDNEDVTCIPPVTPILTRREEGVIYWKALRKHDFCHQLLGHPAEVQGGELRLGVVTAQDTAGYFASDEYGNYAHRDELVAELRRWRLLAQFQSDRPTGMDWGCGGMIYFWVREEDLAGRRFDRVYGMLEST